MALENGNLSAADVAAVTGNNGNWFGGDGSFWIIVLFLFALMGNGWGGNWGGNGGGAMPYMFSQTTNADVQRGFDQTAIMAGINGINTGLANAEISRCNLQSNLTNQLNTIAMNQATGLCNTNANVADLKYTIATEACADRASVSDALQAVNANVDAKVQGVMDKICQLELDAKNETIANLRAQNQALQFAASQGAQTAAIIANNEAQTSALEQYLAPVPRPAYIVQNPNGCGCGNNFYGNYCGA